MRGTFDQATTSCIRARCLAGHRSRKQHRRRRHVLETCGVRGRARARCRCDSSHARHTSWGMQQDTARLVPTCGDGRLHATIGPSFAATASQTWRNSLSNHASVQTRGAVAILPFPRTQRESVVTLHPGTAAGTLSRWCKLWGQQGHADQAHSSAGTLSARILDSSPTMAVTSPWKMCTGVSWCCAHG